MVYLLLLGLWVGKLSLRRGLEGLYMKRKQFIQTGSLATASLMLPKFLKAMEGKAMVPAGNKVVVVLQLSGGNDGLNTVIPFRNDLYYKARPRLGIEKDESIVIDG